MLPAPSRPPRCPAGLWRTPQSVTKICSPVKLHSPSRLCSPDWPTKAAPLTPSCPPAQRGGSHTSYPAHFLISHSPMHHNLTYSIRSRSLPEPHAPVLSFSKSSTPPRIQKIPHKHLELAKEPSHVTVRLSLETCGEGGYEGGKGEEICPFSLWVQLVRTRKTRCFCDKF